jgi:hypothetical protein
LSIPGDLVRIAEQMITPVLAMRDDQTRQALEKRRYVAEKAAGTGTAFYATDQQNVCIAEIEDRVSVIWNAYRRVVTEGRLVWTDEVRAEILVTIGRMLDVEVPYVEEMARQVIVGYGHGFAPFLREARPGIEQRVGAEMDLFALQHRPVGASLRDQLQAPRYSGPHQHWLRVDRAMSQSPPDFRGAAREAVNALEGLAKIVADSPTATLGECINKLQTSTRLDGELAKVLVALWKFANTSVGFRHGGHVAPTLTQPDADYVIESCESAAKRLLSLDAPPAKSM